jgi:hypothetical protein
VVSLITLIILSLYSSVSDFTDRGDMTIEQRTDFINATLCLMNAPPKAPKDQFPGVRSRYHDFMAYHMTNAGSLHDTIGLFPAHKYFVLAYETALRNECGYTGYHPVRFTSSIALVLGEILLIIMRKSI